MVEYFPIYLVNSSITLSISLSCNNFRTSKITVFQVPAYFVTDPLHTPIIVNLQQLYNEPLDSCKLSIAYLCFTFSCFYTVRVSDKM